MPPPTTLPEFTEAMRYDYPLTADSVIIEAGAHRGRWLHGMIEKYHCHAHSFEPINEFFQDAGGLFAREPKVHLYNFGLAGSNRYDTWHIKGDMTGAFTGEGITQQVALINFVEWMHANASKLPLVIDLLEINIEGGEYELLETILLHRIATRFRNIQVQFHGVGLTPVERRREIQVSLSQTHHLTYDAPFIWENWRLNSLEPLKGFNT